MGFKWKDAMNGAVNGFEMGAKTGNPYAMVGGTIAGGAVGGYGKDIDKGVTGDSQSGAVEGALDLGGQQTGGVKGSSLSGLTDLFSKNSDKDGNLNAGNLGQFQGQDLYHSGSGSFQLGDMKNIDFGSLLKIANRTNYE